MFTENGEISEVGFWAGIETVDENNLGYADKKADTGYSFWRMAQILGWYYPNMIYPDYVSQVVFAGKRGQPRGLPVRI
ncbi:MAG: hypothetical protein U0946_04050 [Patescibacteria group bacterium]|nr:hypothetical protein [Patescibacteria group bacterium]